MQQSRGTHFDSFFILGKYIRYVHIPDGVHVESTIAEQVMNASRKAPQQRVPQNERKRKQTPGTKPGKGRPQFGTSGNAPAPAAAPTATPARM